MGGTPQIDLILPATTDPSQTAWERAARRQAAAENALFEARVASLSGEATQAHLVRQAVASGSDAILIVPGAAERGDLDQAIQEARAAQIPVLSVLEPLRAGDAILPVVSRGDYLPLARQVVQAVVDDCKTIGRPATGPALVLVNETATDHRARTDALLTALTEAGVEVLDGVPRTFVVAFEDAKKLIAQARETRPDLPMVFATDDTGFRAATSARNDLEPADRFVVAGFGSDQANTEVVSRSYGSALAYGPEGAIGKVAVEQILAALRAGSPPADIVVPHRFLRAPGPPSLESVTKDQTLDPAAKPERIPAGSSPDPEV
jgi:ABC-type sugar transport system substrate-binding protein